MSDYFMERMPEAQILTVEPDWQGEEDTLEFDSTVNQEVGPSKAFQTLDQVARWRNSFSWMGTFGPPYDGVVQHVVEHWRKSGGGTGSLWLPSWRNDFHLASNIAAGNVVNVQELDFRTAYGVANGRTAPYYYEADVPHQSGTTSGYLRKYSLYGLLIVTAEDRYFCPIGDVTLGDNYPGNDVNTGLGAVTTVGDGTINIELALDPSEYLPSISKGSVELISIIRRVAFAGQGVDFSYMADHTPSVRASFREVFNEGLFNHPAP